jgi:hypothetical protein
VLRRSVVAAVAEEGAKEEIDDDDEGYDPLEEDIGFRGEEKVEEEEKKMGAAPAKAKQSAVRRTFRLLGNKEKKELRAYAHQLGNDICVHQVRNGFSNLTRKIDLLLFFFFFFFFFFCNFC